MQDGITRSKTTLEQMQARVGADFGVTDWMLIDQPMVNTFAKLTQEIGRAHV